MRVILERRLETAVAASHRPPAELNSIDRDPRSAASFNQASLQSRVPAALHRLCPDAGSRRTLNHFRFDVTLRSEMISPSIPDDLARLGAASAGPIRVRSLALHGGADASREDANAPSARCASFEDARVGLNEIAPRVEVAPSTVRLTLKRLASAGLSWPLRLR